MADPTLSYYSQSSFERGIATEDELAPVGPKGVPLTVSAAQDVWCPEGTLIQRPSPTEIGTPDPDTGYSVVANPVVFTEAYAVDANNVVILPTTSGGDTYLDYSSAAFPLKRVVVPFNIEYTTGTVRLYELLTSIFDPTAYRWRTLVDAANSIAGTDAFGSPVAISYAQPNLVQVTALYLSFAPSGVTTTKKIWVTFANVGVGPTRTYLNGPTLTTRAQESSEVLAGSTYAFMGQKRYYIQVTRPESGASTFRFGVSSRPGSSTWQTITIETPLRGVQPSSPTFAPVPEQNRVYIGYLGRIYEFRPELPSGSQFRLAQVNNLPEFVGTVEGLKSAYNPDFVPQLSSFPQGDIVHYFNKLLFMAGDPANPNAVRWTGPSIDGAVDIIPVDSIELATNSDDNSPVVGFATFQQNLYIFKRNSLWYAVPNGQADDTGTYILTFKPIRGGVGCIARGSIQTTPQGVIYLSRNGWYLFNGTTSVKISAPVKKIADSFLAGPFNQCNSVHWPEYHCYLFTSATTYVPNSGLDGTVGAPSATSTFVYDYERQAWWFWRGFPATCWVRNDLGELFCQSAPDSFGLFEQTGNNITSPQDLIQPFIQTQRFGFGTSIQHKFLEIRYRGEIDTLGYLTQPAVNDQGINNAVSGALSSHPMRMLPAGYTYQTAPIEPLAGTPDTRVSTFIPDGGAWTPEGRREQYVPMEAMGGWVQLRVYLGSLVGDPNDEATDFGISGKFGRLYSLEVGYTPEGRL